METHLELVAQNRQLSSYRTYEEWKLEDLNKNYGAQSSYRTYEEWKHRYRNQRYKDWYVLTVPMRNGNSKDFDFRPECDLFLPYL